MLAEKNDFLAGLELSVRAHSVLANAGVNTYPEFMALTRDRVLKLKHAGARTWKEVSEVQNSLPRNDGGFEAFTSTLGLLNSMMVNNPRLRVVVEADGCLTGVMSSRECGARRAERWFNNVPYGS